MRNNLLSRLTDQQQYAMMLDNSDPNVDFVSPMPQNYFRNNSTGVVTDLGPSQSSPRMELDYSSPLEYNGAKGYRVKGDPFTVVMQDGTKLALGQDVAATQKYMGDALKQRKAQAEYEQTLLENSKKQWELDQSKALGIPPGMPKPPKDMRYNAQGELELIPNTPTHQKLAKEMAAAQGQLESHSLGTDALIKNIDQLIGTEDGAQKEHGGLAGSVGWLDSKILPFTKDQATAQALIKGLLSKSAASGLAQMRAGGSAPGSITEREWPIFQNLLATIDPAQDLETFKRQLSDLRETARASKLRAQAEYQRRFGQAAPQEQGAPAQGAANPAAAALMQQAQDAIARGADPAAVKARLQQQLQGL